MLTEDIEDYVCDLKVKFPSIASVWLLGSRANGNATDASDWDFLVFSGEPIHEEIKSSAELHRDDVDLLLADAKGRYSKPLGGPEEGGLLADWEWSEVSNELANYEGTKFVTYGEDAADGMIDGDFECSALKAYRVA